MVDFVIRAPITLRCKFKQDKHCTKIGSKCVEERWFNSAPCLIAEKKKYQCGREIIESSELTPPPKKP